MISGPAREPEPDPFEGSRTARVDAGAEGPGGAGGQEPGLHSLLRESLIPLRVLTNHRCHGSVRIICWVYVSVCRHVAPGRDFIRRNAAGS